MLGIQASSDEGRLGVLDHLVRQPDNRVGALYFGLDLFGRQPGIGKAIESREQMVLRSDNFPLMPQPPAPAPPAACATRSGRP